MPGHRKRRQFKQTDAFTRGMVIRLKRTGWSIRQIAADTHLGASTVHRLWRRWLEQGNVAIYRNVGATRVTSARVDRRILRQAVAAPQATCTAILQHVQDTLDHSISTRTISRRLVANGLHSCRPLRRLPLTPPNRRQRLEWCRARSTWMTEWHRVVFSDESRFCLSSDSRRVRVWRRRGERSNPAAIVERPTVRQRGIMVWGAIAYDSRSPLLRIQGTMTAQRYVDDVLRPVTLPYLQGVPNALYQQDNARPHTARISQQALQDVQMLPWPPYSPDLSPIEHIWDIIGRRLHALPQPRSEDELWQMVEREWRAIPQDAIRTLIDSLPRRVAACIAVRDGNGPTKSIPILSKGKLAGGMGCSSPEGNISLQEWHQFYDKLLSSETSTEYILPILNTLSVDTGLLAEITMREITEEISRLKNCKAAGIDENTKISCIPILFPIFKNGDSDNPSNYRGISLLSNFAKLFIAILRSRLVKWIETNDIIPENQAGFRSAHSCQDHIFILTSVIQLALRKKRGKCYSFFVNLKKAFDTVPHALLWTKLVKIGLNHRFVNLIKCYYEDMTAAVRWNNSITEFIEIRSGVLQGDPLSPCLFLLFINDLIKIFDDSGLSGIYLPNFGNIHLLLYADDIVLIGDSKINLQLKINILKTYLETNLLTLNENKSRIMVFRNGGKVARSERWYWGQSPLSVTSKYTYLGYPLTPSISFTQVALNYRGRTMAAMGAVGEIILKSKLKSFHASMRLLDSMILTVLLYAAPIWANDQALILDRIQDTFLRRFLCLPSYTPGYILRAETGRNSLDITVKKLTLKFWTRILKMDGSRLPSICLAHLWDISISSKQNIGLGGEGRALVVWGQMRMRKGPSGGGRGRRRKGPSGLRPKENEKEPRWWGPRDEKGEGGRALVVWGQRRMRKGPGGGGQGRRRKGPSGLGSKENEKRLRWWRPRRRRRGPGGWGQKRMRKGPGVVGPREEKEDPHWLEAKGE
ncbi:hypothetical protein LAZ67_15001751 [Cordylochernes scorpioides]|uniref:Reverse transcriptase domain-containing protein n=1 Tax=Cordylochernes scorpioides TaxID=51811 RepID=A0ABY6L9T2_9ARAC|nr:hypothetical protein LAZ67_15001751 [Cordylochernes scorpioides]